MQKISAQSQSIYDLIEKNCGFTCDKNSIKKIFTSYIYKLEQKIRQLKFQEIQKRINQFKFQELYKRIQQLQKIVLTQIEQIQKLQSQVKNLKQSIDQHKMQISSLNRYITNHIQSNKQQTQIFISKISNMNIQYQQLIELYNVAKYLQQRIPFKQGRELEYQQRQIVQIQPIQQQYITNQNIHDYNFLAHMNTYYIKYLQRIRAKIELKKSQHTDKFISSNQLLRIKNIHELSNFDQIKVKYDNLKQLDVSNCNLTDDHSKIFSQWHQLSLKKLDISGNNITDKFILNIQSLLRKLSNLNACFTDITNVSMMSIGYFMKECHVLDVSYTKVDEKGIQYIIVLERLKQLGIWSGQQHPSYYNQYLLNDYGSNLIRYKNNVIKVSEFEIKLLSKMKLTKLTVNLDKQDGNIILENNKDSLKYLYINGRINSKLVVKVLQINKVTNIEVVLKQIKVVEQVFRGKEGKISIDQLKVYLKDDQIVVREIEITEDIGYLKAQEIIKKFVLTNSSIGDEDAIQITKNLKYLTKLDLSYNSIGKYGAKQIAKNLKCLINLNLSWNNIGKDGASQIAKNLNCLNSLNLFNNNIANQGAIQIAKNLKCLTDLDLSWNNIGKEGAIQIAKNMLNLIKLNLSNNNIGDEETILIARNLKGLTSLDLSWNSIGNDGAIQIATHLALLINLNLSNNSIGNEGAIKIVRNLKLLTSLCLDQNKIDQQVKKSLNL